MRFASSRFFLGFAVMFSFASIGTAADFTVGTATARAGQKASGYIRVPAGPDAGTDIAVIVVNGAKPGPTLALVAGVRESVGRLCWMMM